MDNNDYEKAKQECWGYLVDNHRTLGETTKKCFDVAFKRAYHLGKAHAKIKAYKPVKTSILQIPEPRFIPSLRLQVAAMAMQGLLSGSLATSPAEFVAKLVLDCADALLNELNKEKNG